MRPTLALFFILAFTLPAQAQYYGCVNIDRVNRRLAGRVDEYTNNHGTDHRINSRILGMPRDLYVYLPPGYDPRRAYPLVFYFHMAYIDEHFFVGSRMLNDLDDLILEGKFPPAIVVCPDGTLEGRNRTREKHSLYINGVGGRFEDHIFQEVIPFVMSHYSIRPEREAHALIGTSSGGFGAMSLALRHRDTIGAVATLAAPLNLRYWNVNGDYSEDFNPATYRWNSSYDPDQVIGRFYGGLQKTHARKYVTPVFGDGPDVVGRIIQTNPADLLQSTDLRPGELAMFIHFGGRDEFNFDAQNQSFAWLAAQRGVSVTVCRDPDARHSLRYFRDSLPSAFLWVGQHILPPTPCLSATPLETPQTAP